MITLFHQDERLLDRHLRILRREVRRELLRQAHEWAHDKAHRIFTRRVLVIVICALVIQLGVEFFHIHLFGKVGELFTAATIEHIFFNVPMMEG